jgi:hypothetical protein
MANPKNLDRCDRQWLENVRQSEKAEIERATRPHLCDAETKARLINSAIGFRITSNG